MIWSLKMNYLLSRIKSVFMSNLKKNKIDKRVLERMMMS